MGRAIPPPIRTFQEMKLPPSVIGALDKKGIKIPTPIQVQRLVINIL